MKHDFALAMRQVSDLMSSGDLAAATQKIQAALGGTALDGQASAPATALMPGHRRRDLGKTLADLAARMPTKGMPAFEVKEPPLPEGARFDSGSFSCVSGARDYRVCIPNLGALPPVGMIMMLHGCTQNPVDFANGTGMNQLAEEHRLIVVYPAQSRGANMQSCWNWFGPADQGKGAGEPAILAGIASRLQREHGVPQGKVFVAGLSAGAAMAVILGQTYPEVFAAVGAHSGLPYKAAHDMPSAFAAMGGAAAARAGSVDAVPTILFHGQADTTVNAANGDRIAMDARPKGVEVLDEGSTGGRKFSRRTVIGAQGHAVLEDWRIDGLGHAWSGGNAAGSYADPAGPDASREMVRFFLALEVSRA